jgi:hypothetical protein
MDMVVSSSTDLICSAVGTGAVGTAVGTNVEEGAVVVGNGSVGPVVLVAPPMAPMAPMTPLVLVVLLVVVVVLLVLGKKIRAGRFALITPPHDSLFADAAPGPLKGPGAGPWVALVALPFITVKMSHATTPSVNKTIITGPMLVALWPKYWFLLLPLLLPIPKSSK